MDGHPGENHDLVAHGHALKIDGPSGGIVVAECSCGHWHRHRWLNGGERVTTIVEQWVQAHAGHVVAEAQPVGEIGADRQSGQG